MEKVAIFLRQSEAINRFRDVILNCFKAEEFNKLHICSGFFQERGAFSASESFSASTPVFPCMKEVIAVGIYNGAWKHDFDHFVKALKNIQCDCGHKLSVEKRKAKHYRWHAKIFIASENGSPVLGIIGSSNITRNAFGVSRPWNYEADVIIWDVSNSAANRVMSEVFDNISNDFPQSLIITTYNREEPLNNNLTLRNRLEYLLNQIEDETEVIN